MQVATLAYAASVDALQGPDSPPVGVAHFKTLLTANRGVENSISYVIFHVLGNRDSSGSQRP